MQYWGWIENRSSAQGAQIEFKTFFSSDSRLKPQLRNRAAVVDRRWAPARQAVHTEANTRLRLKPHHDVNEFVNQDAVTSRDVVNVLWQGSVSTAETNPATWRRKTRPVARH